MFALSMGGHAVATRVDRVLVPGDACLRGNAFGYEPVRLIFGRGKLHAVTGVAIGDRLNANTRSGHDAAQSQRQDGEHKAPHLAMPGGSYGRELCEIPVLCRLQAQAYNRASARPDLLIEVP